jgi:hypothetical protein
LSTGEDAKAALLAGWQSAAMAGFTAASAHAVVHSACSSPSAVHRLPSLTSLLAGVWLNPPIGVRNAGPADLASWLMVPQAVHPEYQEVEDWVPHDPRPLLRVQWAETLWPVHPGLLERPWEVTPRLSRLAAAVDPVLVDFVGFGLTDVTELALRIIGVERAMLSPHWDRGPVASALEPATITEGEVAATTALHNLWRAAGDTAVPEAVLSFRPLDASRPDEHAERLARALQWATADRAAATREGIAREPVWVNALAMSTPDGCLPLPGGLILEAVGHLARRLTAVATRAERRSTRRPGVEHAEVPSSSSDRLWVEAFHQVERSLRGLPAHVVVGVDVVGSRPGRPLLLVVPAARHLIVLDVVADLDESQVAAGLSRARRRVSRVRPTSSIQLVADRVTDEPPVVPLDALPFEATVIQGRPGRVGDDVAITRVVLVGGLHRPSREFRAGTIVLGIDEWCDFAAEADDIEQFWSFLDELSTLPGAKRVTAWSVRDVWAMFRRNGMLHHAGGPKVELVVVPRDVTPEWERAVEADRFLDLTHGLGLAPLYEWPLRRLSGQGRATAVVLNPYRYVQFHADAAFVVALHDVGSDLDRALAVALASSLYDGLEQLLHGTADGARGWLLPDRPIQIDLMPVPAVDGLPPIRFAGIIDDHLLLVYSPEAVETADAASLHRLSGEALADGAAVLAALGDMPGLPEDNPPRIDQVITGSAAATQVHRAIIDAWQSLPVGLLVARESTPFTGASGSDFGRLSSGGRARTFRALAEALRRRGMQAALLTGSAAVRLVRSELVPALLSLLDDEVARLDPNHALTAAATYVERTWAAHRRRDAQRALLGPLSDDDQQTQSALGDTVGWRATNLIIEHMLTRQPTGSGRLDERDWKRLVEIAALALELAGQADADAIGFQDLTVQLHADGAVRAESGEPRADQAALQRERLRIHLERRADDFDPKPLADDRMLDRTEQPFVSLREYLQSHLAETRRGDSQHRHAELWLAVDDTMRATLGFGLDAVRAVLQTAASWPIPDPASCPVAEIDVTDLIGSASTWSRQGVDEIAAAARALTLDAERLAISGLDFWNTERRQDRLATRPLVGLRAGGQAQRVLVLPHQAAASQQIFANYQLGARLPWPHKTLPAAVQARLAEWAQFHQREFEKEVTDAARCQGLEHLRPGLRKGKAARHGLVIPGEIDLLAADPETRRLWVIEAKNTQVPFSIDQIFFDLRSFHGTRDDAPSRAKQRTPPEKAHVGKLLAKTAAIRTQLDAALRATGISDPDPSDWTVHPVIVTRDPVAAAFVTEPQVPFACLAGLERLLSGDASPTPGYVCSQPAEALSRSGRSDSLIES